VITAPLYLLAAVRTPAYESTLPNADALLH
jgi:hypothetical protein